VVLSLKHSLLESTDVCEVLTIFSFFFFPCSSSVQKQANPKQIPVCIIIYLKKSRAPKASQENSEGSVLCGIRPAYNLLHGAGEKRALIMPAKPCYSEIRDVTLVVI
jgi:hypothetical protein